MSASGSTETNVINYNKGDKQKYLVLDHNGNHEYDLVVIDHGNTFAVRTIELYHSMVNNGLAKQKVKWYCHVLTMAMVLSSIGNLRNWGMMNCFIYASY